MCSCIRAFTEPRPAIRIHPATGILGLPACGTRGQREHIRQDKIGCLVFHHHCTYLKQLCYLEFGKRAVYLSLVERSKIPGQGLDAELCYQTPHSQLLNPAVIKLPNLGCDHEKACGNFPFCTGPVTGTASLVIIIIFRDDGRLS